MTERKSTEIKIRVTPSEKARWQADSEREGVSLSELICRNMNIRHWQPDLPVMDEPKDLWSPESHPAKSWMYEGQTPPERRTESCSHSKPPYAFCAECDT